MSQLFDPDVLHSIARKAIENTDELEERFNIVIDELDMRYPGRINTEEHWIMNSANGALGQMRLLYASLSEYILLFGTPIGTEGHSGRYFADVYDFMLDGEMWTCNENEIIRNTFIPGDKALLKNRCAKAYCVKDHGWMLEYAHGAIPAMLPMGLADNFFSNLDFRSVWRTVWLYGRMTMAELLKGKI